MIDFGITPAGAERDVSWPGQACACMVGILRLQPLREQARGALGPRFRLQHFHAWVLQAGSVPRETLAGVVGAAVDRARAAAAAGSAY